MSTLTLAVLIVSTAFALWRSWRTRTRYRGARIGAQLIGAALLYCALFPPPFGSAAARILVLTPGATPAQLAALDRHATLVALPDAAQPRGAEAVVDLASALRRHPQARQLAIVGAGLPARDRDAARGLALSFDPAPELRGIAELSLPEAVASGNLWQVDGRAADCAGGKIEVRDPTDSVVASAELAGDGRFRVLLPAKSAGDVLFRLRLLDARTQPVEELPLPLSARDQPALQVVVLGGAASPEWKYLRRWLLDSARSVNARTELSRGIALREGQAGLNPDSLRNADLLIVDERSWTNLTRGEKSAVLEAVRGGMGLLLRVSGPIAPTMASEWSALGIGLSAADLPQSVRLNSAFATAEPALELSRWPLKVDAPHASDLLRADDGSLLAIWQTEKLGRIGVWWLTDSFRLVLAGRADRHATLWSRAVGTLARARQHAQPQLPTFAIVDQRISLCDLTADASIAGPAPTALKTRLIVDPASPSACAGYWPRLAGWHTLVNAEHESTFYVHPADEAPSLQRARDGEATRLLVSANERRSNPQLRIPLPRWPFFVAWLLFTSGLWWFERRLQRQL